MVDPQASRFWQAALLSGLMDVPALTACWKAVPPEKREAPEHVDRRLARQAVQHNYLTLWQAQQLLAGRTSGFRVDRYLLLDLIGHGGMGRVYLARDTRLNRLVALKILAPERMNNPRAIERFKREARVGAQLQHENLVRIYDFGESNGRYFLVMEYIEGKTVGSLITSQGPMPSATAARLARQIALGLDHAHRKGLIHRDVNPYNILVTHDGTAKLADLGLALDLAEEERVTREGATVGTFDYVAPEQARHSHSADIRSDIYSLGCTIYHMIAGQVPFPSPSLPEKLFAHHALDPPRLDLVAVNVPAGLVEVVRRMMRKNPDERYATPLQVAQALEPYLDDFGGIQDHEPTPMLFDAQAAGTAAAPSLRSGDEPAARAATAATAGGGPAVPGSSSSGLRPDQPAAAAPNILSPADSAESDATDDVPLVLDLGPEPSLSESLTRPRPWFGIGGPARDGSAADSDSTSTDQAANVITSLGLDSWRDRPWLWALTGMAVTIAVVAVGLALAAWLGRDRDGLRHPQGADSRKAPAKQGVSRPRREPVTARPDPKSKPAAPPAPPSGIAVLTPDGQESPAPDLLQAMESALGGGGSVVLSNREPLRLASIERPLNIPGRGSLAIRAAAGVNPVLTVELKGRSPFLATGPGVELVLDGVTLVAHCSDPGPGGVPPPLIQAAGAVNLKRCALRVGDRSKVKGFRGVVTDGGALTVEDCWFEGFDTAVEVHSFAGTSATLRQTMVVPSAAPGTAPPTSASADRHGWGLEVRFAPGGQSAQTRKVVLDHCTFSGAGLLDLAGFSPKAPLQVEARGCAVQTEALVAWRPAQPEIPLNAQTLQWSGEGNQYDVNPQTWIVLSTRMTPALSTGVTDVAGWSRLVLEKEPIEGGVRFLTSPEARSESLQPQDFAVAPAGARKAGADPARIGPWARGPASPSG